MPMNDDAMVKIMSTLGLNFNPAEQAIKSFEGRIASLNKQLLEMKALALQGAKEINAAFSSQMGQLGGGKVILDQFGQPLKTVQTEAKKTAVTVGEMATAYIASTRAAKEHANSVQEVTKKYSIFGNEMQRRSSWFLTGTIFYGGIKAAKEAIQTISEVEMGVTEIARVMEDSTFVFKEYRDELLQLGVDYGQTFDVVQDIALRWAQAGYNVRDSLDLTKTALLALNTAELDAANATESMIGIMAQWGLTAKDLPLVLDKINKTADDFTVTSQDLVDGLLRSSGAAKIMGLSLDETIALLTVMREASGRTGREVGNALNSILSYVQRAKSIEVFESLGIQVFADEAKTQFRNVLEIFRDIAARWDTLSADIQNGFVRAADDAGLFNEELATALGLQEEWNDLQQRDIAQAAAGVYRRNYFIGMIERLSQAQEVLNNMMDAAGYSMRENERTMDTLAKKYQSLKAAAEELAVALGDAGLLNLLKGLTEMAKDAVDRFAELEPEMKALVTTTLELLAAIKAINSIGSLFGVNNVLGAAVAALPGWSKLLAIIPAVGGAIALYAHNAKAAADESLINSSKMLASQLQEKENVEKLIAKYEELRAKVSLTDDEQKDLRNTINELAQIYPHLQSAIEGASGALDYQIDAIKRLNQTQKEALLQQTRINIARTQAEISQFGSEYENISKLISESIELANRIDKVQDWAEKFKTIYGRYPTQEEAPADIISARVSSEEVQRFYNRYKRLIDEIMTSTYFEKNTRDAIDRIIMQYSGRANEILQKRIALEENQKLLERILSGEFDTSPSTGSSSSTGTGGSGSGGTGGGSGGFLGNIDKYVLNLDRYMALNAVLDQINIALEKNNALESMVQGRDRIIYLEQENQFLKQKQDTLHAINNERRKELEEIKAYLKSQGIQIDSEGNLLNADAVLRARTAAYNLMPADTEAQREARRQARENLDMLQDKVKRYVDLIHREIPSASAEWIKLSANIAKNNKEIEKLNEEFTKTEFEHWARMGVYSIQQQIDKLKELYSVKKMTTEEQWELDEKIFELYKDALKEQQDVIKDAYEERLDLIDEEIKKINEEKKALKRSEEEHDYQRELAKLQEELAYWSVRTSEEARKRVAELTEQIAEKQHDREVELQEQALDDKIDLLEEEKRKWQTTYKDLEKAFDDHRINIVARAAQMSKEAYQQWVDNYLVPLQRALREGNLESFQGAVGNLIPSIENLPSHDWGMTEEDYQRFIANGQRWMELFAAGYRESTNAEMQRLHAENDALRKKYGRDPALGEYPKFHEGAKTLSYGLAMFKPGELVFPPDLSIKLENLISALYARPIQQASSITDNRKEIRIDKLLNIERNYMEDEIDSEIISKELKRAILAI